MNQLSSLDKPPLFVGIDWADRDHDACVIDDGRSSSYTFENDPNAIAQWLEKLRASFPGRTLIIAVEQGRGGLMQVLLQQSEIVIYSLNPKQLARYREAVYPTGRKNDEVDAELIAMFLINYRHKLRPVHLDDEQTRKLGYLSELRRKVVEERKRLGLKLESMLKLYFPLVLSLFKKEINSDFMLDLLSRWPSLTELKRPHPKTLREFFREHGVHNEERQTEWINDLRAAKPMSTDQALIEAYSLYVQSLVRQIRDLNRSVAEFDEQLKQTLAKHPDVDIFSSVPGAGKILVPRLIAAFGSDRDRYQSAEQLQAYSGIAPITKQSGKSYVVSQRLACPKFLKQTFHEFADQAWKWSSWSRAFYDLKRSQGMKHHATVRALAFKWMRILYKLWKTRTTYSEEQYVQHLRSHNSPLLAFLKQD